MTPKICFSGVALVVALCSALCSGASSSIVVSCPQGVEVYDQKYDMQPRLPMFAECKNLRHLRPSEIRCQISKQLMIQAEYGSVVQWIRGECATALLCLELKGQPNYSQEDGAIISTQRVDGCCQPRDVACIRRLVNL